MLLRAHLPKRRGSHPLTVLARSTSTKTLLPSIFLPSACLYAAENCNCQNNHSQLRRRIRDSMKKKNRRNTKSAAVTNIGPKNNVYINQWPECHNANCEEPNRSVFSLFHTTQPKIGFLHPLSNNSIFYLSHFEYFHLPYQFFTNYPSPFSIFHFSLPFEIARR